MPRVQVDAATIDQDQAATLVAHHLAMAAALFQALPEGNEAETMRAALDAQFQGFELERKAASFFVASIVESYEALRFEDGKDQQEE